MYTHFHYKLYNSAFQLSEYEIYLLKKIASLLMITLIHVCNNYTNKLQILQFHLSIIPGSEGSNNF
jgi:hypothetical protein